MYVDPVNPIIRKTLTDFLTKELEYGEQSFDSDNVIYSVQGQPEQQQVLYSFKCNAAQTMFDNGATEMLEAEYAQFALPREEWLPDWDVTLRVSSADFP